MPGGVSLWKKENGKKKLDEEALIQRSAKRVKARREAKPAVKEKPVGPVKASKVGKNGFWKKPEAARPAAKINLTKKDVAGAAKAGKVASKAAPKKGKASNKGAGKKKFKKAA